MWGIGGLDILENTVVMRLDMFANEALSRSQDISDATSLNIVGIKRTWI